jgi:hypothetical protein
MKQSLVALIVLIAEPTHVARTNWLQQQTENMHQLSGPFISRDYGFSIQAPSGTKA